MTRAFSDDEKEIIRKRLIEKGKELFGVYGLKKTGVNDITRAVGIAQGSFYSFFPSKEELFFEILEEEERAREKMLDELMGSGRLTSEKLRIFLKNSFEVIEANPIVKKLFESGDIEILMRKLPREKIEKHIQNDLSFLIPIINKWRTEGSIKDIRPEVVAGLVRCLFVIPLYKKELGGDVYPEVVDLMVDMVTDGLIKEGEQEHD